MVAPGRTCSSCRTAVPADAAFCPTCGAPTPTQATDAFGGDFAQRLSAALAERYRLVRELGRGGMAIVYLADDLRHERQVAIKVLRPELAAAIGSERFVREIKLAAKLNHPHILALHDSGEADGFLYYVMPYVEGESLRDRLQRERQLPIEDALQLTREVAEGLDYAHERGVIHRDIKPENILLSRGHALIADFGIAKAASTAGGTNLTSTGTSVGTPLYMSPEQAAGEPNLDHRADIYSLGCVLYEMLAGEPPFTGPSVQAIMAKHAIEARPSVRTVRDTVPESLDAAIRRAMARAPADRFDSAHAFAEALCAGPGNLAAVAEGLKPLKAKARPAAIKLAVLPFANLTGDADQEFLSDGLTQEMITLLGRLHPQSLGVIARTSVMRYKKSEAPIDQIGRELGVGYVLEGSVRREGSRVRVSADLIEVRDQVQLWGDAFEREMSGILALQNDVAKNVAKALALMLLPSEQARLAKVRPVNPEAHDAYLRGSFHVWKLTPGDLDIAEKYFDLALEKDPAYAPAYAGRAWVWAGRGQFGLVSPEEAGPKAKSAALRAVELDENLAGAHEVLAGIRTWIDWDWGGAWGSWRRAIELNPNVATARALYAHFLMIMGHGEEALEHSQRAVELDPFNPLFHGWYAYVLYMQRRCEEAIAAAREALRFQADFPVATCVLWLAMHEVERMEKESFEFAKSYARVAYDDTRIDTALDEGYARGGYAEAMKRAAEALIARLLEMFCKPSDIAFFYAVAGEKGKALEWLEKGFEVRDQELPYIGCYPCFDDLRPDPRFHDLLRKMRLPDRATYS